MAEPKTSGLAYVPGADEEAVEANRRYKEALEKLTASIDQRKNRFFDPVYLAAARGFLAPGAPDFFESLGRVASNINEAQKTQEQEERDIAQQQLNVATQGLELIRQKAADREFSNLINRFGGGAQPAQGGLPGGAAAAPGALPSRAEPKEEIDFENFGIQIAPPDQSRLTGRQYLEMSRFDRSKSPAEKLEKAAELDRKNIEIREGGQFNLATGKFYPTPTGKTVEVEVFGYPGTYLLNERDAAVLSNLARSGNAQMYKEYARRVIEGPLAARPAAAEARGADGAPETKDQPAPSRLSSVQEREANKRKQEVEQAEARQRAEKLGGLSAEKEASLPQVESSARSTISSTARLQRLLNESPNVFGIFSNPTITSAFAKLIQDGIQTPRGSLNFGGFEEAVLRAMPGIKPKDLDNYRRAVAELAEIELGYTQTYMKGQGQITEGERKIVRALGGQVSDSAATIRSRAELIEARAKFEIDSIEAFRKWQDQNPGKSYLEFERKSEELKKLKEKLSERASGIYDKYLSSTDRFAPRAPAPNAQSGQGLQGARRRLDSLMNQ